jgi:ABC-type xylose transport system permease subunit
MSHTERKHWWLLVPVILIIVAGVVVDSIGAGHGEHAGVFSVPGFWSVFGLVGCLVLAGACKLVARLFLKRPENYYDDVL